MRMIHFTLFQLLLCYLLTSVNLLALYEGSIGKIDASAKFDATYDSRIFGISSSTFNVANQSISRNLTSEDDFILKFSPALHFSKKVKWFTFTGSAVHKE